jgi:hypothetical protein
MINTRFAFALPRNGERILDFGDNIADAVRELAAENDARYGSICFPNGVTVSVDEYEGRTAGEDAEVAETEYDALPVLYATLIEAGETKTWRESQ